MKNLFYILSFLMTLSGFAQGTRTIKGKVSDSKDGMPLYGVTVYVENASISNSTQQKGVIQSSSLGTVTDFDGTFELKINGNVKFLRVTYIGYESTTLEVTNQNNYSVSLKSETAELKEVVVTGYQKIETRKLTSAIGKANMIDIQQAGVASIDQLLIGQVTGVAVTQATGAPGTIAKVRIRGTASLSGPQDPLWVLDGLPLEGNDVPQNYDKDNIDQLTNFSIAGLNPEDIKDITILKDASATAIYGARAANGVIVVTTKKGKKGNMRVNFTTNTFITQRPDFSKLNLMNSSQKVDLELAMASDPNLTYRDTGGQISRILNGSNELAAYRAGGFSSLNPETQNSINALRNNNTNWGNLLYQDAVNKQYGVSVSGGGEKSDYYFSLGAYNEEGTTIGTGFDRYNLTLKNNFEVSDKLRVGVSIFGSQSTTKSYLTDTDGFTNPSNYSRTVNPYLTPRNADGSYNYDKDIAGYGNNSVYVPFNILEERENTSYELKNRAIKAILDIDYNITKNFKATTQVGLQFDNNASEKFADKETYYTRKEREKTRRFSGGVANYFLPDGGIIQNSNTDFFQYNWKTMLNYSAVFNQKHEVEVMAGSELRKNYNTSIATKGFGFDPKTLTTKQILFPNADVANDANYKTYQKTENENAFASFFATASYTYNRKYTAFGSVRYDGSDLFGVDPKYKYLPLWAISGSWLVSEENFLKENPIISALRLRASYGLQGNIDKNTSPYVVGEYKNVVLLPGQNEPTIFISSPPNDKLRWEKTTNTNFGFDLGLFNNRVSVVTDVYGRKSTDLIGLQSLPIENGFEFSTLNWAQVSNKGYEIALTTKNIERPNFSWTTNINFSHNKSNVDRIQIRENTYTPSREGYPVNAVFALKTAGIDENGYPLFINKNGETVNTNTFFALYDPYADLFPGEISQSRLTATETRNLFTYVGDRDPKFTGGFINTFKVHNFDLTIATTFNIKQTVVERPPYSGTEVDRGQNYSTDILNAYSPTNTSSNLPGIVGKNSGTGDSWMAYDWYATANTVDTYALLDTWVKEMSYMRLSSLRLGYSLPKKATNSVFMEDIRFSVEGRNLFVLSSDYKGYFDPETYGNIYAQPIPRSISLGCNLTF
ncbi:SusC/RagA family TonB-linked outer membrane protein [Flavobacterium sp. Fl-77]|uniref:SusC/RagA family TonB-linked outer membrane protein n=1 Tax=Flavobacterium flavipigmentatum TaxID=2893884 RepID=A0AAJ2SEA7_9FLAO|nr:MULTISPECIES: SusC/RagA family TonB-linked outer membrane protein [unclassified Flavobacterium]MDX6183447.1 SusC/RagA family TonB-linked outer membrane protein [Flavobacterium sp. Fl-33]MDX6186731.1 SusC/RagA family TonB-linked outer membrane protein [Flavobacterium sp. Fl-77]UFH38501.1 SusC/RagA family TonB-linked outer membrane protein [Flavobacterium sp. F-70]